VLAAAAVAAAQSPAPVPPSPSESAPFQCWWRSDAGAIRLGEVVEVALTCAALERDDLRAVPDESRLTVAAIQLAPFEIVGGDHPPDLRRADRRLFEYRYRLRLIDPDVIGRDVKLPPLSIPYRVESRVGAGSTLAGRDLVHLMPQLVFRVVSQVPADATDIRDAGDASLASIDAWRFRAAGLRVAALLLAVLAVIAAVSAVPGALAQLRHGQVRSAAGLSDAVVLRAAAGHLGALIDRHPTGELDSEALAEAQRAVRIIAASAAGLEVRQMPLAAGAGVPEGRLVAVGGWRRRRVAVTASATAASVERALEALPADASSALRARLEQLRDSLATMARAAYGAGTPAGQSDLAELLRQAREAAAALARQRRWGRRDTVPPPAPPREP
ncbi:MAG: hypothetical protein AB7U83_18580, partial [Vicinamibacterales bacterium]